jgi:hypothetical protein
MFANINVIDDRELYTVLVNVMMVVDVVFVTPKNPDAGTIIHLRDGRHWESPDPRDVVMRKINQATEYYSGIIMVSFISEYMKQQGISPDEPSKPKKKPTVRKKRTTTK